MWSSISRIVEIDGDRGLDSDFVVDVEEQPFAQGGHRTGARAEAQPSEPPSSTHFRALSLVSLKFAATRERLTVAPA